MAVPQQPANPAGASASHGAAPVLFEEAGRVGILTLNRPEALNALNLEMIRLMDAQLRRWQEDTGIAAVVVRGAGDRAFCSGGDVKAVALDIHAKPEVPVRGTLPFDFFYEEYRLNHLIYHYKKPYIALVDGIVMGGGKGISAHGSHRVVTEKTLFAMPETHIGFFPDVGGGYFLPRCPGETGTCLALTSTRIAAADTLYIGFGTHYVPSEEIEALTRSLVDGMQGQGQGQQQQQQGQAGQAGGDDPHAAITRLISAHARPCPQPSTLADARNAIDRHFSYDRVEDIIASLAGAAKESDWARQMLAAVLAMSPTSQKIALRQIRQGAGMNFDDVMVMEFRISQRCVQKPDFYEGIRAALIDKDRKPRWNPARAEDVRDADVLACFVPLPQGELTFL